MAAVIMANGGDNLVVYIPLFAIMIPSSILIMVFAFLIFVVVWRLLGFWLTNNRIIGDKIKNYGHIILPGVLTNWNHDPPAWRHIPLIMINNK